MLERVRNEVWKEAYDKFNDQTRMMCGHDYIRVLC